MADEPDDSEVLEDDRAVRSHKMLPGLMSGARAQPRAADLLRWSAVACLIAPPFKDTWHLIDQELEEPGSFLKPSAGPGIDPHHIDSLTTQPGPLLQFVFAVSDHLVPVIGQQPIDVAPFPGPVCLRDEMQLDEVAHGSRDGGRAGLQCCSELGRGGGSAFPAQQQSEDAGRHPRHAAGHHGCREAFDEIANWLLFRFRLHRQEFTEEP